MKIKIGGEYGLRDKGAIRVLSAIPTDTFTQYRCRTETGETVFYNEHGRSLPLDSRSGQHDTVSVIWEPQS